MLSFVNDYSEGCHPLILEKLREINLIPQSGYGTDGYTESAKERIRAAAAAPDADIYFLVGGTQTNLTVIASLLRPFEGVIAAESGHVAVHEGGAIEAVGHKVLSLPAAEGKLRAADVERYLNTFYADGNHEHMVFPGMVYISHPTELGTLYTKEELTALSAVCRKYSLPLYLDGARLGYGLAAPGSDVTLPDVAALTDAFYIGGTKVGALFGEAVVFPRGNAPAHFFTMVKQRGALLAKGWLTGLQFDVLFTDNLYLRISENAIRTASLLREGLREKGYEFLLENPTNQIFVILDDAQISRLSPYVSISFWEGLPDERTAYRFATSWATREEDVRALLELL